MGRAEELKAEQERANEAAPAILVRLREKADAATIGREIASGFGLDERTAYRLVVLHEEAFDRSRRRTAFIGAGLMFAGVLVLGAGVVLAVLNSGFVARPVGLGAGIGLPLAGAGALVLALSRRIAGRMKWRG